MKGLSAVTCNLPCDSGLSYLESTLAHFIAKVDYLQISDHGDHPITRDHPIADINRSVVGESQVIQSAHTGVGAIPCNLRQGQPIN